MASKNFSLMTPEERAKCGRNGGVKSGESRRMKKAAKETLGIFLSMPVGKGRTADVEEIKNFAQLNGKNIIVQDAMLVALVQRALGGDLKAIGLVLELIGEGPAQKNESNDNAESQVVIINDTRKDDENQ